MAAKPKSRSKPVVAHSKADEPQAAELLATALVQPIPDYARAAVKDAVDSLHKAVHSGTIDVDAINATILQLQQLLQDA